MKEIVYPGLPIDLDGEDPVVWLRDNAVSWGYLVRLPPPSVFHALVVCYDPDVAERHLWVLPNLRVVASTYDESLPPRRLYGWIVRSYIEEACQGLVDLPLRYEPTV